MVAPCHDNFATEVPLSRPRLSRQEVKVATGWVWLGISRSRQNFSCRNRELSRLKVSRS